MATILIVDDDHAYRAALSIALGDRGHTVISAPDAERALYEFSRHPVDAAIVDVRLQGLSGTTIMRALRRATTMPIIAISGGDIGTDVAAREAGADVYLQKPVPAAEIHAVVDRLLDRRE